MCVTNTPPLVWEVLSDVCVRIGRTPCVFLSSLANEASIVLFLPEEWQVTQVLPSGWQPVRPTEHRHSLLLPTPTRCFVLNVPLLKAPRDMASVLGQQFVRHVPRDIPQVQRTVSLQDRMSQCTQMAHLKIGLLSRKKQLWLFCGET